MVRSALPKPISAVFRALILAREVGTPGQIGDNRRGSAWAVGAGMLEKSASAEVEHSEEDQHVAGPTNPRCMSRIPIPSHSPSTNRSAGASHRSLSPVPFPDRASSPLPPSRPPTHAGSTMSTISGSHADTRRKTNRRDEVSL